MKRGDLPKRGSDDHLKGHHLGTMLAPMIDNFLVQSGIEASNEIVVTALLLLFVSFAWSRRYDSLTILDAVINEIQRLDKEYEQTVNNEAANNALVRHLTETGRVPSC